MKKIWKYALTDSLNPVNYPKVEMQRDAKVLAVREAEGMLTLWALVDTDVTHEKRYFAVVGTGQGMSESELKGKYLDSVITEHGLVWHVFEV